MCGLAGFLMRERSHEVQRILPGMGAAISHRGPDAEAHWFDADLGVGLVHRRLSIQDLSPAGAQPMLSESGRFVIVFNGEIYNFRTLRQTLESNGATFRGHSDTEVMLAAIEAWGLEEALDRFSGMFAFALLDRVEPALYLARDRMGEKPLYYGWQGATFLFGSELKALQAHPDWQGKINVDALPFLLRHNLIPAPYSIFSDVCKLLPAHYLRLDLKDPSANPWPEPIRYWDPELFLVPDSGETLSRHAAADRLESILDAVVQEQMISDVPLGAFLSGGIDSSTVVAMMKKQTGASVRTFSIGFDDPDFNEAEHAKAVAEYLGTKHTELYVKPEDAQRVIPKLPHCYDEPFADSSQIPTYLVSEMTRQHVTVALSGDGGDELFCGYTRYPGVARTWELRHSASSLAKGLLAELPSSIASRLGRLAPGQRHRSLAGVSHKLQTERSVRRASSLSEYYQQRVSFWPDPGQLLKSAKALPYSLTAELPQVLQGEPLKTLMWRDLHWYLPDDILTKVDRAAMAHSLETRIPLLDRRVVEFALGLPASLNVEGGVGKQVLREVLYRHVPRELIERPKKGFAVPIAQWLRGPLQDWAEGLLEERRLTRQGYWQVPTVRWVWKEHLSGREDFSFELWGVLMFQAWLDNQRVTNP